MADCRVDLQQPLRPSHRACPLVWADVGVIPHQYEALTKQVSGSPFTTGPSQVDSLLSA